MDVHQPAKLRIIFAAIGSQVYANVYLLSLYKIFLVVLCGDG